MKAKATGTFERMISSGGRPPRGTHTMKMTKGREITAMRARHGAEQPMKTYVLWDLKAMGLKD